MPDHAPGQPLPGWVDWECCNQVYEDGTPCTGATQSDYVRCLVHLDDSQLAHVMSRRPNGTPPDLDGRGTRLATGDLERLLSTAPLLLPAPSSADHAFAHLGAISLAHALVTGDVSLEGATIEGDVVSLDAATIEGRVLLRQAMVKCEVSRDEPTIVSRDEATIVGGVLLERAAIKGGVSLDEAAIEGGVALNLDRPRPVADLEVAWLPAARDPTMFRS